MVMNIAAGILGVIALAAGVLCWMVENHCDDQKANTTKTVNEKETK